MTAPEQRQGDSARGSTPQHVPVIIVGAGPVGLAVAGELGWRGSSCLVLEKGEGIVRQPKMDLVGVRTMEFCRRWGLVADIEAAPYPRDVAQDYIYVTTLDGHELGREPFASKALEPYPPQSPQKRERCPQHMFDPIMRRFAESFPTVELQWRMQVERITTRDNDVELSVRDLASDNVVTLTCDWLIGADGGDSMVRKALGIGMSGGGTLTYTTNVLIRCDLHSLHDIGAGYRYIFVGPEGTWLTITSVNGRDEWRVQFIGNSSPGTPSLDDVRAALFRAVGRPFEYEIIDVMPWVRRELVADRYAAHRCFIVGDAAHLMSPTGAFGMNTGMQDAVDLGWKLDAVMKGWGGSALLWSYEQERRPVAMRNVAEATANLARMLETRKEKPPAALFEEGPAADAARKRYGDWYAEKLRPEWFTIGIHLGYRYEGSDVIVPEDGVAPPLEVSTYRQTTFPGSRAPHAWLAPGESTLDHFGPGFTMVRSGADKPDISAFEHAAAERGVPWSVLDIGDPDIERLYERKLVLVRPDGHVAWRGDELPEHAGELLDRVRGMSRARADA